MNGMKKTVLLMLLLALAGAGTAQEVKNLTLEESVRIALENNPDIRIAEKELTKAKAGVGEAVGALLPSAVISDHWQDPETGNYFALCRLTFSILLERIAMARMLPESLQRFTLKEGPLLFDRQNLASEV